WRRCAPASGSAARRSRGHLAPVVDHPTEVVERVRGGEELLALALGDAEQAACPLPHPHGLYHLTGREPQVVLLAHLQLVRGGHERQVRFLGAVLGHPPAAARGDDVGGEAARPVALVPRFRVAEHVPEGGLEQGGVHQATSAVMSRSVTAGSIGSMNGTPSVSATERAWSVSLPSGMPRSVPCVIVGWPGRCSTTSSGARPSGIRSPMTSSSSGTTRMETWWTSAAVAAASSVMTWQPIRTPAWSRRRPGGRRPRPCGSAGDRPGCGCW